MLSAQAMSNATVRVGNVKVGQSQAAVLEDLMNKIEAINIFIHHNFMYANNIAQDE